MAHGYRWLCFQYLTGPQQSLHQPCRVGERFTRRVGMYCEQPAVVLPKQLFRSKRVNKSERVEGLAATHETVRKIPRRPHDPIKELAPAAVKRVLLKCACPHGHAGAPLLMLTEAQTIALFQLDSGELDDCATLDVGNKRAGSALLVTTDMLVEGTHFKRAWLEPEDLAARLFFCNHSDLCASGAARAAECMLQLGLPQDTSEDFVRRFARKLMALLRQYDCTLLGGDTFRSPHIVLGLTVWGSTKRVLARRDGRPGDTLYVSGPLGLSQLGLCLLEDADLHDAGSAEFASARGKALPAELAAAALNRFRQGQSRPDWAARAAGDPRVHAAIDVSDGLRTDAGRLALASGVLLEIDAGRIPLPPAFPFSFAEAIDSGEEYEILFLGTEGLAEEYGAVAIGRAVALTQGSTPGVTFMHGGRTLQFSRNAYEHFAQQ